METNVFDNGSPIVKLTHAQTGNLGNFLLGHSSHCYECHLLSFQHAPYFAASPHLTLHVMDGQGDHRSQLARGCLIMQSLLFPRDSHSTAFPCQQCLVGTINDMDTGEERHVPSLAHIQIGTYCCYLYLKHQRVSHEACPKGRIVCHLASRHPP